MKNYKADISPLDAWEKLKNNKDSILVDVRSNAEWFFVGVPHLHEIQKECIFLEWQVFPEMYYNLSFFTQFKSYDIKPEQDVLFLCRSGARSAEAAGHITAHGFKHCYNIKDGFEGDADSNHKRSCINGWRFENLPWIQS